MANILKNSKRGRWLPRVDDGCISVGERYSEWSDEDREGHARGVMPPMLSTLDVWAGQGSERVEYQLQLTEDETLRVVGEWLSNIARRRAQHAARAKLKAATS